MDYDNLTARGVAEIDFFETMRNKIRNQLFETNSRCFLQEVIYGVTKKTKVEKL